MGYLTSNQLEMNIFYMHNEDFSMNAYLESNFKDYQFYDFDFTYQFKFPFSIGLYTQFDNSYLPGVGITLGVPLFINGNFFDPYVKTFYETHRQTTGINVGFMYSYSFFEMMIEADFYANEGLDMLMTQFTFYVNKTFGIYTGFDLYNDMSFDIKLGFSIKFAS